MYIYIYIDIRTRRHKHIQNPLFLVLPPGFSLGGADAMMKEIFHRGPISCGVDANPLLNYESGTLNPRYVGAASPKNAGF